MSTVRIGRINRTGIVVATLAVAVGGAAVVAQAASSPDSTSYAGPPAGARWDYQIGGGREYSPAPAIVSRDNGDAAWQGLYNICYVNAFQSQPGDQSLKAYWLVKGGSPVEDPEWKGEYILDTRGHSAELVSAFTKVMSQCASKGFAAVEFDNLDSFDRSKGGLSSADNVAYARELIRAAHGLGLATAQKNAAELAGSAPFDFAIAESCLRYDECGSYTRAYGVVLDVEYQEEMSESTFQSRCSAAVRSGSAPSFVFRDTAVSASGVRRWCDAQPASGGPSATTRTTSSRPTSTTPPSTTGPTTTKPSTTSSTATRPTATGSTTSTSTSRTTTRPTTTRPTTTRLTTTRTTSSRPVWRPTHRSWTPRWPQDDDEEQDD